MKLQPSAASVLKRLWVNVMAKKPVINSKQVKVTLIKSIFGQLKAHQETVRGLGLRRIRQSRVVTDTPEVRGMIVSANHMLQVEEV
jgi:large subunit ribosomal protein L30